MNPFPINGVQPHEPPEAQENGGADAPAGGDGLVLLTLKQAARRLHITPQTLGKYCKRKRLAAFKLGRSWIILESVLEDFKDKPRPVGRPKGAKTKKAKAGPAGPPAPKIPAQRKRKPKK